MPDNAASREQVTLIDHVTINMPAGEAGVAAPPKEKRKRRTEKRVVALQVPRYHVILLDDDAHTYEYVIEMLMKLFGHTNATAFRMACEVDLAGRVVVDTTHRERAELKRDQIHEYGADWRIDHCRGSMSAVIEPAE